jgi:histidinol-phosphate aminotransferase
MSITTLARKNIQALTPYLSARRIGGQGDIWLNANESPFIGENALNRYSECQPPELINAYSAYCGLPSSQILTSRGSDEGIDLLLRAFCEPNQDAILYCPPTYGMYSVSAQIQGVNEKIVPLTPDWQLDIPAIQNQLDNVKIIFVCRPNNPTGNLIPEAQIQTLLNLTSGKSLVVLDEAYVDFCPEKTVTGWIDAYPNLVILRTLSKAFGLAGLRCGFLLAQTEIIQLLLKIIAPYPVPIPVSQLATKALSPESLSKTKCNTLEIRANRAYLQAGLNLLPNIDVFDSDGNFLLIHSPHSQAIFQALWENGIIIRQVAIKNTLRISVGSRDECEKILAFLRPLLTS